MQKIKAVQKEKPQCANTEVSTSNNSTLQGESFMKDLLSISKSSAKSTTKNILGGGYDYAI